MIEEHNGCPIEITIQFLGQKWMMFLLRTIFENDKIRFSEIQKKVPKISPRTLSKRLLELEENGFLTKKKFNEIPPRVEYSLTQKGKDFAIILEKLNETILNWS